ncbi:MAG: hypothetical protein IT372_42835 [Polyangiaceae bacterium]|nr:hypothetical protein [Polyangiaceae bacterium]
MLRDLVLSAILALAHPPAVDVVADRAHLEALAAAITEAVIERDDLAHWLPGGALPLPFPGPRSREAAALALVAIAHHESAFSPRVSDCRRVGTDHPSITAWQLWGRFARGPYSIEALCGDPRLAAERALWILAYHADRGRSARSVFDAYASGSCGVRTRSGARVLGRWRRLMSAAETGSFTSIPAPPRPAAGSAQGGPSAAW